MANAPAKRNGDETTSGTVVSKAEEATALAIQQFGQFRDYLATRAETDSDGLAVELTTQQLGKVLYADNEEAMWASDELAMEAGKNLADVEMSVQGITFHTSSDKYKAPLGHYVVVRAARLDTGESFTWNTGSPLVIAKLRWLEAHGKLPAECVIRSYETPNGERLRLMPVPKRATRATAE